MFAQDSTAVLEPKLSFDFGMTHDFNFNTVCIPCQTIPESKYEGYSYKYYWQPSLEALYNFYLFREKKNHWKDFSFSIGLKLNYEKNHRTYDTTCYSKVAFRGGALIIDEKTPSIAIPLYFNYKKGAFILRAGIIPGIYYSFETDTYLYNLIRKTSSWNLTFNSIVFRMDYTLHFSKKISPYVFCYYNGFWAHEFGGGIGIPLTYYK